MAESCCSVHHEKVVFFETLKYKIVSLSISLVALVLAFLWNDHIIGDNHTLMYFNPAWIVIVICGIPLFSSAIENLMQKKIKSSLLISISLVACVGLEILGWTGVVSNTHAHSENYLFAGGEVAFLMMIGELLEDVTVKRSRSGIEKLVNLAPKMANIFMNGKFVSMPVSFVQVNDIVLVKPHEQITVDGKIVKGETSVNQSAITGESMPLDRKVNDVVYAGTWNDSGAIEICVLKPSDQTTVARMVELIKEAETKRAPIASIADKWAGYIVPFAIVLSILVFFVSMFGLKIDWSQALVRGVTVLVVFCPCSLALATPTAIAAGIGNASYRGILVKSGQALESLAKVDTVVFDKTGTLTTSQIQVKEISTNIDEKLFLEYLGSAEKSSEHPLAKAIIDYATKKVALPEASLTKSLVGVGVQAVVNGKNVVVAKYDYFAKDNLEEFAKDVSLWESKGYTIVGLSVDEKVCGVVGLFDTVKANAFEAIDDLNMMKIDSVMLTGDNFSSAKAVFDTLNMSSFKYSLLPEDKVSAIEEIKGQNHHVCMVGDGVNDAPSLASADCSIAMGAMGSDIALEVADVALMTDSIEKIPGLLKLSKKTLFAIKRNIIFSMSVNLIAVILSFFGLLTPVLGALVHNCSSVFVVFSSSLLLLVKDKKSNKPYSSTKK